MQVIGLCRFSYLGLGGFQVEHESLEERAAFLYDPARLDARFRAFEACTLPAMKAQTDPDFTFLVVIGDSFPDWARARLDALLADFPQAVVQTQPPRQHRAAMRDAINSIRLDNGLPCLQFRMDDDDAVAVNFVERLRRDAERIRPLIDTERHVAIDYRLGWAVDFSAKGLKVLEINEGFWTPGLAIAFGPNVSQTIMNFSHNKLVKAMPSVSFTEEPMFIRGISDMNDSRQKEGIKPYKFQAPDAAGLDHFRTRFAIDAERVKAIYRA